ncbi:hypothetical protein LJE86_11310 [bacterium BMS3Abin03]|jgi:hypothetical protein|nr:hypothetical protein [bacterium BMS3Abin03]MCG6960123.1 hypothetical protein [bacterium BMS3Abin03]
MKASLIIFAIILISSLTYSQDKIESDIDFALQYAKKGIYWALANIPEKKTSLNNDLISEDRLYASVRLEKEVNGIKIESTGYYQTLEVKITIYRSNDSLKSDGYLHTENENKEEK